MNRGFDHGCQEKSEEESCQKESQKEGEEEVVSASLFKGQHTRTVTTSARTEGSAFKGTALNSLYR